MKPHSNFRHRTGQSGLICNLRIKEVIRQENLRETGIGMGFEAQLFQSSFQKMNKLRLTAPVGCLFAMCTACDLSLPALKVWETDGPVQDSESREGSDTTDLNNTDENTDSTSPTTDTDEQDSTLLSTDTDITSCEAQPNFTLCRATTEPDRDFDICIEGQCLSPGCGMAECNPPGLSFSLPDTGQKSCFDHIREIPCDQIDSSFAGQDGQYGWDVTHDKAERFVTSTNLQSDEPVIEDLVTGLVWQGCAAGQGGAACQEGTAQQLTWNEALDHCNKLSWDKKAGWRLPSRFELMSILNLGGETDASFNTVFPNTPVDYSFWSIDTLSRAVESAYSVDFAVGYLFAPKKDRPFYYVRCIWSGNHKALQAEPLFSRATDVEDTPTVLQSNARKTWQGCVAGRVGADCKQGELLKMDWKGALAYCQGLDWAEKQDWRLPNVFEMLSITNAETDKPVFDPALFPETPVGEEVAMWTATTVSADDLSADAWTVTATSGTTLIQMKNDVDFFVRCVSDGP